MPGLALLELGRGDTAAAAATMRRAVDEARDDRERTPLLAAAVEILRAEGDIAGARVAADELAMAASSSRSPLLAAMAAQAVGAVLLAEGDPVAALAALRTAASGFGSLRTPYEVARTAVLSGLARAALGDHTTAAMELDNARTTFAELGAGPDLERVDALVGRGRPGVVGLSGRERDVLAHLVAGRTNREIAEALVISHHTVRRHVENIFTKLGVTSRAAATAYAYEHGLVARR
jgi:DNA-binding NarL/FixJ family response regulator